MYSHTDHSCASYNNKKICITKHAENTKAVRTYICTMRI